MPADQVAHLRQALQGLEDVIAIVLILLGAVVAVRLSAIVIRHTMLAPTDRLLDEARRRTLQPLLESLVRYVVSIIALVMILRRLNVDATAILATGGAGFIGSHVVDAYVRAGHQVVVVDSLTGGRREQVNAAAQFYAVDIRSPQFREVFERERPDVINHHAAQASVIVSINDPRAD